MDINELKILKEMFKVLSIPFYSQAEPSESAVVIAPGKLQDYRIIEGAKLWPSKAKYLWVTGAREEPKYTRDQVVSWCGADSSDIILIERGWNAKEQALGIYGLMIDQFPDVRHVIIATASYHLPRWFLTFLQVIKKKQIIISPVPLLNLNGPSFFVEDLKSEIERIKAYRIKGDIASSHYLNTYLRWRLSQ